MRFHQLEEGTGSRIRLPRVSEQTGEEVTNDRIVKGYELEKDKYVIIEAEEIASLKPKATRQIEIEDFVDLSDIDPVFFEQPYYLIPDKDNAKAYRLLAEVMEDLGKVAIGRFVLRSKEALVAIRPVDGTLVLETMRFADEVLAIDREQPLAEPASEPTEREKEMARQLVNSLTAEFDPDEVPRRVPRRAARAHRQEGGGRGDRGRDVHRGTGEGARPHGRARSEPGAGGREAVGRRRRAEGGEEVGAHRQAGQAARGEEGVGQEDDGEEGAGQAHAQVGLIRRPDTAATSSWQPRPRSG